MSKNDRRPRSVTPRLDTLESRQLLTLIAAKPTIDVVSTAGVKHLRDGSISIVQPTTIQVFGSAQPGPAGSTAVVAIYAEDSEGNLVNGGSPLATATPDSLGRYSAVISLPSRLRADINYVVARETTTAVQTSALALNGSSINNLTANLNLAAGTLSGLNGSVANPTSTLTGLNGTITTPTTAISGISGTITTPVFPTSTGTAGPAVSTLLGGTGTLDAQVGTLANGTGTIPATTSTLTQTGTAAESARTGTLSNGTGTISASTGTSTTNLQEVATSDPLTILIHQSRNQSATVATRKVTATHSQAAGQAHALAVHRARHGR